jgi:hypothetical protein
MLPISGAGSKDRQNFRFHFKKWRNVMTRLKSKGHFIFVILLCGLLIPVFALAQPPGDAAGGPMGEGPQGQQDGQGGRQRMQMDPEQMQQMMARRYQELLGMSDEEWAVIGPYVLNVSTLSQSVQTRGSGMRMMMGARGNMPAGTDQEQALNQRGGRQMAGGDENLEALQTLLEDENATTGEIKSKLSTLRAAREKSKQELIAAQKELRELLTLRQEAMLVVTGLLE